MQKNLSKIFAGVGVCLIVISIIVAFTSYNDYLDKMASYDEQYATLKQNSEDVANDTEQISAEEVETQLHSVKDVGVKITTYANRLQVLSSIGYAKSANYDEKATREEQSEIATIMSEYFGDKSVLRTTWFSGDLTAMNNQNCWSFMNSYDFSENTISVLWLCKDGVGNVVAYVTADYHADTNSFDNVERHMTTVGVTYVPATGNDGVAIDDDVVDDVTDISNSVGLTDEQMQAQEDALNDEEWQKAKDENNSARDQLRDAEGGGN